MRTLCYSVRLQSLTPISSACFKAVAFDGSTALIPASQYFGQDYDVQKCYAYWISAWILGKKDIQYSCKKAAWFDSVTMQQLQNYIVEKHKPSKIKLIEVKLIKELQK